MSRIVIVILIYHRHKPVDPTVHFAHIDSVPEMPCASDTRIPQATGSISRNVCVM
jgi:hypothetical protein